MLPEQEAPFRLTAMTLRGIGSYLHGARLELRPLTVLCGANGSGKSTWLKVLNLLKRSLDAGTLPFGYDIQDWAPDNIQLTNAFYHLAEPQEHAKLATPDDDLRFGPPGTIGLEFQSVHETTFPETLDDAEGLQGAAQEFLWLDKCPAGTRFRVRLAHPSYWADNQPTPVLGHLVELQVNDGFILRMKGERDPFQKFEKGQGRPRRSKPYELYGSPGFLPEAGAGGTSVVRLAAVVDLAKLRCEPSLEGVSPDLAAEVVEYVETRLRQLLRGVLDGFFFIGAVRQQHEYLSLEDFSVPNPDAVLKARHVGPAGEYTWFLERHYAHNNMRPVDPLDFRGDDLVLDGCIRLFAEETRSKDPRLARLWDGMCFALAHFLSRRRRTSRERAATLLARRLEACAPDEAGQTDSALRLRTEWLMADLLNVARFWRKLFDREAWTQRVERVDPGGERRVECVIEDAEIARLVNVEFQAVSHAEVKRLNHIVIEKTLDIQNEYALGTSEFTFEDALFRWLGGLLDIGIVSPGLRESWDDISIEDDDLMLKEMMGVKRRKPHKTDPWEQVEYPHCWRDDLDPGFLTFPDSPASALGHEDLRVRRLSHPCFGEWWGVLQPPREMSAGFHQVFPILVQLGLMKWGELIGVENPEVHLHPSLQLKLAQALVVHAKTGRQVLVETHSDLVIRRVLRAILQEEIAQAQVGIYFTDLDPNPVPHAREQVTKLKLPPRGFRFTRLSPIQTDERGRISNWPEGFLDDDVKESQRLLDIMYGGGGEEDDDE